MAREVPEWVLRAIEPHVVRVRWRSKKYSVVQDDAVAAESGQGCSECGWAVGQADLIITFNTRDLRVAYDRFGILVLTPREFLAQFGSPT